MSVLARRAWPAAGTARPRATPTPMATGMSRPVGAAGVGERCVVAGRAAAARRPGRRRGRAAGADRGHARRVGLDDRRRQDGPRRPRLVVEEGVDAAPGARRGRPPAARCRASRGRSPPRPCQARRRGRRARPGPGLAARTTPSRSSCGARRRRCAAPRPWAARSSAAGARCRPGRSAAAARPRRRSAGSTRWPTRSSATGGWSVVLASSSSGQWPRRSSLGSSGAAALVGLRAIGVGHRSSLRPRGARAPCGRAPCRSPRRARG